MVAYDVEPMMVGQAREASFDAIRHDFQTIAELGFPTIMMRYVDRRDRRTILDIARDSGLSIGLCDLDVRHYVRTAAQSPGRDGEARAVPAIPSDVISHPAFTVLVVESGPSSRSAARCESVCSEAGKRGVPCVLVGDAVPDSGAAGLARIDTRATSAGSQASMMEAWLRQYHHALIAGRTTGLVFDRYRRMPGDGPGIAGPGGPPDHARLAAVKELAARARLWGPRLTGATPEPLRLGASSDVELSVTTFSYARRRYVLVFNRSPDRYARSEVMLPELTRGTPVIRAVEVPASASNPVGRVINPRRGRVGLPVDLRPGDAVLFELF
ncbi:MAG: hypothetical protein JSU63_02190 [Phycisphaerales bacterium]|nr:MAG: hypothetical protein JSU63_02190 [Phycisphaerales bacterium]